MRLVIFRDDDISFFTDPKRLEAIYGRLWSARLPVCLALIPRVRGDARVYWTRGNPYDPAIPPAYRGRDEAFSLSDNADLCAFLDDLAQRGLVEICLHGYEHSFFEFTTHDRYRIRDMLDAGMAILKDAIPSATVRSFIAPYDRLSPVALKELIERGFHIVTQSWNLSPRPDLPQIAGHASARIAGDQTLFICDEYLFTHKTDPSVSLRRARQLLSSQRLTIISNHHWMFTWPAPGKPCAAARAAWHALLDEALGCQDIAVATFSAG